MPLLSETQFRDLYVPKTATAISSQQILEAFRKAEVVVRGLVGDAAVNDAKLATPTNAVRGDAIRTAHDYLTRRELLDVRSTRFTDYGILHSTRDANGQLVNTMEDVEKIEIKRASLLADARDVLDAYLTETVIEETTIPQARSKAVAVEFGW
jgi:hypothetical protein